MGGKSGGGGLQVTGYKYYLSMLMGLCRGPIDEVLAIKIGDLSAWTGSITGNDSFQIDAPNLFGGDQKEGGVQGGVDTYFGAPDQDLTVSDVATSIGGDMPSLRGLASLYYKGAICSNSPYPKAWAVRVRRALNGWHGGTAWYPEEAIIPLRGSDHSIIAAMNPAHIIYECLTNPVWGRGLPTAALDEPSFTSAAKVFCAEGFGLCLKWSRATDLGAFVQLVMDHVGGAIYVDRTTGLLNLKLIRKDYEPSSLPVFDYSSGLLELKDDTSTAVDNSHSEILVNWLDPIVNKSRQVRAQNLAGIQASQTLASSTVDYLGLPTEGLAERVAMRDLMVQGSGIKRYTVILDRRGRKITPAGVFRINVPSRSINNMVVRAGKIEEGSTTDQRITISVMQDVFGLEATTYLKPVIRTWTPPDRTARAAATRRAWEMTYRDTVRFLSPADLATVPTDAGDAVMVAKQPTGLSVDYKLATHAAGEDYATRGTFGWTPTATLENPVGYYDTDIILAAGSDGLDRIGSVGMVAWLEDECVQVAAYDLDALTMTIARGCLDTVPVPHLAGSRLWFPERAGAADGREFTSGEVVKLKVITRTNSAVLALDDAPEDTVTIVGRQGRPYPPGDVQINGHRFGDLGEETGDLVFTWTHRDRVLQADHPVAHGFGDMGPEAGTTYTLGLYSGVTLIRETTGITANTWTYDSTMVTADGFVYALTAKLKSMRDGLASFQQYEWSFHHTMPGIFDYGFDYDFDGS